ncbi:MAG: HAD family hydrolase, partial [Terriglobales bacterium]
IQLMYGGGMAQVVAIGAELAAGPWGSRLTCLQTLYPQRDLGILDILDAGVDKGAALAAVAARQGVRPEAVLAIGDNYNDLGMLGFAGRAVLMGNAHAAMDRPGWARTADNDHAGVAQAVEAALTERL